MYILCKCILKYAVINWLTTNQHLFLIVYSFSAREYLCLSRQVFKILTVLALLLNHYNIFNGTMAK